ncbi:MAG: amidohydrolase [Solirubrobacterales bacterium]|nr:amidohydrolase [Solirubrobacterales bacterium]
MSATSQQPAVSHARTKEYVVDTDSHNFPTPADVMPHMPAKWAKYLETFGLRTVGEFGIPRARLNAARGDAWSPAGKPPGNDPEFFIEQLLDKYDIDAAILNNSVMYFSGMMGGNQPFALTAAFMAAANDWAAAEWLPVDDRFFSSISVAVEDPAASVAEIERWSADDRFVHVGLPFTTRNPLGTPKYWPMLEAAAHHDLPLSLHPGNAPNPLTGSGWPSFYFEDHMCRPAPLLAQITSLIAEGVFDRFPDVKFVIQEGGWSWVRPYLWRLDETWAQLRDEEPYGLERRPSEYVDEHFWFTSQPMEEPEGRGRFAESLAVFGLADRLMYASDYPHWDFDPPDKALPTGLSREVRERILGLTAAALYPTLPEPPAA